MSDLNVYIYPHFGGEDRGDGGIRRVVEAQLRHLPARGCSVVDSPDAADLIAVHIAADKRLLERYPHIPLVVHNHGVYWEEYEWKAAWQAKANASCMESIRQADAVTAPSEWVAQSIRRNSLRPVRAIGHGVDLEEWEPGGNGRYVLWNKTRVDPVCDPEPLNELARLAPKVPFMSTYGDTNQPNINVVGVKSYQDAKEDVTKAGVYLCTTRETFGIGTLEAMAAGVPVLGWRWGGQAEFIEHGVTGWLAEPGDYEGLLEGLRYCLKNRERMGREARAVVEARYQWKDVIGAYADLYNEVVARHRRPGPKVSVIVTAYNLARYLPEALYSVAGQTMGDWECIIVDDASPDDCGEIADRYAVGDDRFRVIHNAENQYLAGALNTGIAAAHGRYILPLDADNKITPQTLSLLSNALDNDRSTHIAYGDVLFVDSDGETPTVYENGPNPGHSGWPPEFRGEWQLQRRAGDGRPANLVPSTAMYRREVWECTGGYRRRYRTAEDADFWSRATSYGFRARMVTRADTLIYRNLEGSMSRAEPVQDWTRWLPWSQGTSLPPAAVISSKQPPVPSFDPPEIAVVIPVGPDHRDLVVDALDSVDAQVFRQWECIVVNDSGSPLRWTPSWATVIETHKAFDEPVGVAKARNIGIAASTAPLFVPLDADDTLEPDALGDMLKVYRQFGGYVYSAWYERWEGKEIKVWEPPEYDAELLLQQGCIHAVTGLFARDDWERLGGYHETLPAWEDWDFQLKLANAGVCGTKVPWPLFTYRKDTGSRCQENYDQFDAEKFAVFANWLPYFKREETLMSGCGGCGGGGGRVPLPARSVEAAQPAPPDDVNAYVVVEYVGRKNGTMGFRGPSGQSYRFGATETEKRKYVLRDDAEFFEAMVDFRILQTEAPVPA